MNHTQRNMTKLPKTRRSSYQESRPVTLSSNPQPVTQASIDKKRDNWKQAEAKQKAALAAYLTGESNRENWQLYLKASDECDRAYADLDRAYNRYFEQAVHLDGLCEKDWCEDGHDFGIEYRVNGVFYHACKACGHEEQVVKSYRAEVVDNAIADERAHITGRFNQHLQGR